MPDRPRFDPGSFGAFRVVGRSFDSDSRTVTLRYALDDTHHFVETITFETPPGDRSAPAGPGFERALLHLHIAAGTSYYKTAAPSEVLVEEDALSPAELSFHHHLYDDGLREFALTNGHPVPRTVTIHPQRAWHGGKRLPAEPPGRGLLVPIGGGKDSMVLIEAVRHLGQRLFAVNPHPLVVELASRTGLELLVVRRRLDPGLTELHESGALNGHVPVTAIISLIAVVGAFVYGYDTIAMAIERSASEATVSIDGVPVNHQYTKSLEFEQLLRALVAESISRGITYGSALRPYSELAIARTFAGLTGYHDAFCSCNTVFRQTAPAGQRWCGHCPKCRFVGLMLAPFLRRDELTAIIGTDMFADPGQVPGFAALMSDEDKPFECVGERGESAAALRLLAGLPEWRDSPVVGALGVFAEGMVTAAEVTGLLTAKRELDFPDDSVAAAVDAELSGET